MLQTEAQYRRVVQSGFVGHRGLRWFTTKLIWASVPPRIARQIEAVAMDATDVPSWAKWRRPDEQSRHGLDPDATRSHRSANSERESGLFYGYFLTPCIAVKARRRTRSTKKAKFGDDVPAYVVSMIFRTAAASVADSGLDAMEEALKLCPNISEVVADRGYTQLGPTFNRGIHRKNIDITMDYKKPWLTSAKPVGLGPSKYPAFFHAGTFLHAFTPPNWRVPPAGLQGDEAQGVLLRTSEALRAHRQPEPPRRSQAILVARARRTAQHRPRPPQRTWRATHVPPPS